MDTRDYRRIPPYSNDLFATRLSIRSKPTWSHDLEVEGEGNQQDQQERNISLPIKPPPNGGDKHSSVGGCYKAMCSL